MDNSYLSMKKARSVRAFSKTHKMGSSSNSIPSMDFVDCEMEAKLEEASQEREILLTEITRLEESLRLACEEKQLYLKAKTEYQNQNNNFRQKIVRLQSQNAELRSHNQEYDEENEVLRNQLQKKYQEYEELDAERETLLVSLHKLEQSETELKKRLQASLKEAEYASAQQSSVVARLMQKEREAAELGEQLLKVQGEIEVAKRKSEQEISRLTKELEESRASTGNKLQSQGHFIEEVKLELSQKDEAIRIKTREAQVLAENLAKMQEAEERLTAERQAAEERLTAERQAVEERLTAERQAAKEEERRLKLQLQTLASGKQAEQGRMEEMLKERVRENEECIRRVLTTEQQLSRVRDQLNQGKVESARQEQKVEQLQKTVRQAKSQVAQLEAKLRSLQQTQSTMEQMKDELVSTKVLVSDLRHQLDNSVSKSMHEGQLVKCRQLLEENGRLVSGIEDLQRKCHALADGAHHQRKQIDQLSTKNSVLAGQVQLLQFQKQRLEQECACLKESAEHEARELSQQLKKCREEMGYCEKRIKECQRQEQGHKLMANDMQRLQYLVQRLKERVAEEQTRSQERSRECQQARVQCDRLRAQLNNSIEQGREAESVELKLRQQIQREKNQRTKLNKELDEVRGQYQKAGASFREQQQESKRRLESAQQSSAYRQLQIKRLRQQLNEERNRAFVGSELRPESKTEKCSECQGLRLKLEELIREKEERELRLGDAEGQLLQEWQTAKQRSDQAQRERRRAAEIAENASNLESRARSLQEQLHKAREQLSLDRLQSRLKEQESKLELERTKSLLELSEKQISRLRLAEQEVQVTRGRLARLEQQNSGSKAREEVLRKEKEKLEAELLSEKMRFSSTFVGNAARMGQLNSEIHQERSRGVQLNGQMQQIQEQLTRLKEKAKRERDKCSRCNIAQLAQLQLKDNIQILENTVNKRKEQIAAIRVRENSLKLQLSRLAKQIQQSKEKESRAQQATVELRQRVTLLSQQLDFVKDQNRKMLTQQQRLVQSSAAIQASAVGKTNYKVISYPAREEFEEKLKQSQIKFKVRNQSLQNTVAELRQQLQAERTSGLEARRQRAEAQVRSAQLQQQSQGLAEQVKRKQREVTVLKRMNSEVEAGLSRRTVEAKRLSIQMEELKVVKRQLEIDLAEQAQLAETLRMEKIRRQQVIRGQDRWQQCAYQKARQECERLLQLEEAVGKLARKYCNSSQERPGAALAGCLQSLQQLLREVLRKCFRLSSGLGLSQLVQEVRERLQSWEAELGRQQQRNNRLQQQLASEREKCRSQGDAICSLSSELYSLRLQTGFAREAAQATRVNIAKLREQISETKCTENDCCLDKIEQRRAKRFSTRTLN